MHTHDGLFIPFPQQLPCCSSSWDDTLASSARKLVSAALNAGRLSTAHIHLDACCCRSVQVTLKLQLAAKLPGTQWSETASTIQPSSWRMPAQQPQPQTRSGVWREG